MHLEGRRKVGRSKDLTFRQRSEVQMVVTAAKRTEKCSG